MWAVMTGLRLARADLQAFRRARVVDGEAGRQAVHDARLVRRDFNSGWLSPKMIWSASRMASAWADHACCQPVRSPLRNAVAEVCQCRDTRVRLPSFGACGATLTKTPEPDHIDWWQATILAGDVHRMGVEQHLQLVHPALHQTGVSAAWQVGAQVLPDQPIRTFGQYIDG